MQIATFLKQFDTGVHGREERSGARQVLWILSVRCSWMDDFSEEACLGLAGSERDPIDHPLRIRQAYRYTAWRASKSKSYNLLALLQSLQYIQYPALESLGL